MSALPGLGTTLVRGRRWQKSPITGESTKETVKTIACGNAGRFRCTRCYSCAFYYYKCTRGRGCNGHPAFPTPSLGGRAKQGLGRFASRGRARICCLTICIILRRPGERRDPYAVPFVFGTLVDTFRNHKR